jgi:hypothetical protein
MIQIENVDHKKVLVATNEGKVILETLEEDRTDQLWKKGEPDNEGYFSLENSQVPKLMTAISSRSLEIQGNITLKWINTIKFKLIGNYLPFFGVGCPSEVLPNILFWSIGTGRFVEGKVIIEKSRVGRFLWNRN